MYEHDDRIVEPIDDVHSPLSPEAELITCAAASCANAGDLHTVSLIIRSIQKACGDEEHVMPRLQRHLRATLRVLVACGVTLFDPNLSARNNSNPKNGGDRQ